MPNRDASNIVGFDTHFAIDRDDVHIHGANAVMILFDPDSDGKTLPSEPKGFVLPVFRRLLRTTATATLQAELLRGLDDLDWYVIDQHWERPNGTRAEVAKGQTFGWLLAHGIQTAAPVTAAMWSELPRFMSVSTSATAWRSLLVDAYETWWRADLVGTILRAATAVEVGATPFLGGSDFNVPALNGAPLQLNKEDNHLFVDITQLWYSRHGIIHRGESMLYNERPKSAVGSARSTRMTCGGS